MNKVVLNFGFSGWLILIFVLVSLFLTYFYYRKTNPTIERKNRILLGVIRFFGLLFLFIFFSEPIFNFIQNRIEKPKVVFLIDNSASMKVKWDVTDYPNISRTVDKFAQTKRAITESGISSYSKYPAEYWKFDESYNMLGDFKLDSFRFDGFETNLLEPLRKIYNLRREENIGAIFVVTDGIINSGENPAYLAEQIGIPIYTIGVGDTIPPKDVVVTGIVTNELGFVDKPQPVKVNIKSFGFDLEGVNVQLFEGKDLVSAQKINLKRGIEDYSVVFDYTPKAEGFAKLVAKVQVLPNEFSSENNSQTQIVKIVKSKKKYVLISGYPVPDISYIKSIILQEKGSEVLTFIQKQGAEFYDPKPTRKDFEDAQVFILLGFPINSSPNQILDWVKEEWNKGKSVLFVSQLSTDYRKLKPYEEFLPFNFASNNAKEYTFVADFRQTQSGNPILNIASGDVGLKLLNQLPPIFRTELFVRPKPESEVLATIKVGNSELKEPFLLTYEFQNRKSAAILGYGIYRWRLLGQSLRELMNSPDKEIDPGSALIMNILNWLSANEEFARVRIKPNKTNFHQFEQVSFTGQVYDETQSPVDNALVKVRVVKDNTQVESVLPQIGSGLYSGNVGTFDIGEYNYIGEAYRDGKLIGSSRGKFIVEKSNLEMLEFRSRFSFLQYISNVSGGKFFFWNETDKIKTELDNLFLQNKVITQKKELYLWNYLPLLILSILFFSIEWLLRRKKGLL
jgi:hypothetical protein